MACQFLFSTDLLAAKNTRGVIEPVAGGILRKIFPFISDYTIWMVHVGIRKLGHVAEFAILTGLWLIAFDKSKSIAWRRALAIAGLLSILYAGLDEWHQTFTRERTGRIEDVFVDGIGVLAGLGCALLWYYKQNKK